MTKRAIMQGLFVMLAAISLLASSVSACTCSHHQHPLSTETRSCHDHHDEDSVPVAEQAPDASCFDETCICVARDTVAAVKPDKRTVDVKQPLASPQDAVVSAEPVVAGFVSVPLPISYISTYTLPAKRGLLPSRAPPRL